MKTIKHLLILLGLLLVDSTTYGQITISNDSIFIDNTFVAFNSNEVLSLKNLTPTIKVFVFKPINKKERGRITTALNNLNGRIIQLKFIDIVSDSTKLDFAGAYLEKSANQKRDAIIASLSSALIASIPLIVSLAAPEIFVGAAITAAVAAIVLEVQSINNTRKAGRSLRYQTKNETLQESLKNYTE